MRHGRLRDFRLGLLALLSVAISVVLLSAASPAVGASTPIDLVVSSSTPAAGATIGPTSWNIPFQMTLPSPPTSSPNNYASLYFEVATQNVPGVDGTLADDLNVGGGLLKARDSNPTIYEGTLYGSFASKPGTYFVQGNTLSASCPPPAPSPYSTCTYRVPTFTITIASPAPSNPVTRTPQGVAPKGPLLSLAAAKSAARRAARRHWNAKGLVRASCTRDDRSTFSCRARWRRNGKTRTREFQVVRDGGRIGVVY